MVPHLQADSCAGIEKYLVTSVVNWDHLGLVHMDPTGAFQEINQPVGVGKSGLRSEEKSQFSLNSCTGQAGASCSPGHRNNLSSWQLQEPNSAKSIFTKGNGESHFRWSCSYRVEFGEEWIQWGHFYFRGISEASHWTGREIFFLQVCLLNSKLLHELGEC